MILAHIQREEASLSLSLSLSLFLSQMHPHTSRSILSKVKKSITQLGVHRLGRASIGFGLLLIIHTSFLNQVRESSDDDDGGES